MYDFHYNIMKKKYGDDCKLLFTDTDSLCYEVKTGDFYKDIYEDREQYDLSDVVGEYHDSTNKKVVGKMKLEYPDDVITQFIGLRSKMYSIKLNSDKEEKKAKGVVKSVVERGLKHEMYDKILMESGKKFSKMKMIRSIKHRVYTIEMNKISLSAYDDKRYLIEEITSLPYGHYKTR